MAHREPAAVWTVKLPVSVKKEGAVFVATIPALDIASQGDSRDEAVAMLEEAAGLVVEHCLEKGTWMRFLDEKGVAPTRHSVAVAPRKRTRRDLDFLEFPVWMLPSVEQTTTSRQR